MNARFAEASRSLPELFRKLEASSYFFEKGIAAQKKRPGIYVFYEGGKAVHVGRTRDLGQRLRGHISRSHYSASFAFKRARRLGIMIGSMGPVRAKLIRKGMIYSPAHGDLAFTVPLFDEFMIRQMPTFE